MFSSDKVKWLNPCFVIYEVVSHNITHFELTQNMIILNLITFSHLVHRQAPSIVLAGVGDFYVGLQPRY